MVANWTTKNIAWPSGESPSAALATWEMTVGEPLS